MYESINTGTGFYFKSKKNKKSKSNSCDRIDNLLTFSILLFVSFGVFWLVSGTVFALIASIILTEPYLSPDWAWLTFGRIRSAHLNSVIYGWLFNNMFVIVLWITAKLSHYLPSNNLILVIACSAWNFGVFAGVVEIIRGNFTSIEWLEFSSNIVPILAFSYLLIGVWGIVVFKKRTSYSMYISQWYIMAALFWFPWLYLITEMMIVYFPARGTVQAITNWWFAHNILGLWLTPITLSAVYYFIPKILNRPIKSYYLSLFGFWSLALFYNWAGVHHLIGGPIPMWLITIGIVASVFMVIPVIITAINHHLTVVGHFNQVWLDISLRFIVTGSMMYTMASLIGSLMALREINEITHFTHVTVGHAHHGTYGFVTMVVFGSLYYILPQLLNCNWPSVKLIKIHFWSVLIGLLLMLLTLHIGGWIQGVQMNNPEISVLEIAINMLPWLRLRTLSGLLLAFGHSAFCLNFIWILLCKNNNNYLFMV